MHYRKRKYRYARRPGRGNFPFYSSWWDKFYTKPGYHIKMKKGSRRAYKVRKSDDGLPF